MAYKLKAPFPWWGGKSRAADVIWQAFGADVNNYVEPCSGSLAVLLARPGGPGKIETVNDKDRMIANFWRAVRVEPETVAHYADWPINEADLHARHQWLVSQKEFYERMHSDPDYYDAKIAGWWVWGICQWIGGGWCVESKNHKRPHLGGLGKGVHSGRAYSPGRRPVLSHETGVHRNLKQQLPKLSVTDGATGAGGVHLPSLGNDRGLHGVSAPPALEWFRELQARLRRVRVACGDWRRVLGPSTLGKGRNVGGRRPCAILLDPPYDPDLRARYLYTEETPKSISAEVREWALEHGDDPDLRIALCGYEQEHIYHMPPSWRMVEWKGARGYAGSANQNRTQERIWFSPHCLTTSAQRALFSEVS